MNDKLESTSGTRLKERGGWLLAILSFGVLASILYGFANSRVSFHSIESFKRSWSSNFHLADGIMINDKILILFAVSLTALFLFTWGFTLVKKYHKMNKVWRRTKKENKFSKCMDSFEDVTLHAVGASKFNNDATNYSYLEFKDAEGKIQSYSKPNIIITSKMHVNFEPGAKGDFYFSYVFGCNFLVASNIQGEKRYLDKSEYSSNIIVLYFHYFVSYGFFIMFVATIFTIGLFLVVPLIQAIRTTTKHAATKEAVEALAF